MNIASKRMYFLLAGLSFVMPFLTGFLGLLPIDQSIVFEAGGRISKGEWPFTHFYLPYGLVPAFIQSGFFKLLGVSWFSYVFHAAVFNAIFALILFDLLRIWLPSQKHSKLLSITLLASWSFYPMMGTPFMDTHSFFFGLLSYWSVLAGMVRKKPLLLLLCFTFLLLGFYSKPLPVIFWGLPYHP